MIGLVPYDDILAIDEHGDKHVDQGFDKSHIYVHFNHKYSPFTGGIYEELRNKASPDKNKRINYFPSVYPEIE